jgi:hypothetical protein
LDLRLSLSLEGLGIASFGQLAAVAYVHSDSRFELYLEPKRTLSKLTLLADSGFRSVTRSSEPQKENCNPAVGPLSLILRPIRLELVSLFTTSRVPI